MKMQKASALPSDVLSWVNDDVEPPDWVKHVTIELKSPNGSFMIHAKLGPTRVHQGHVVVRHFSGIWVCSPENLQELMESFAKEAAPPFLPVGPGKVAQFGTKRRATAAQRRKPSYRPFINLPPVIEWVKPDHFCVDPTYQRSVENHTSQRLIASIAANWDWRLCAPLIASKRHEGTRVIIDGQHRWAAALRRGDVDFLPCALFVYDSPEEEARMFILANRARKAMSRLDDFHAAIAAGDEDALEIRDLVQQAGLRVARFVSASGGIPGEVGFTSAVAYELRKHGPQVVSAALTCMAESFPGQPLHSAIFSGLVALFASPPSRFDPDALPATLAARRTREWSALVKDQRTAGRRAMGLRSAVISAMGLEEDPNPLLN
jgi:hypothetical protein